MSGIFSLLELLHFDSMLLRLLEIPSSPSLRSKIRAQLPLGVKLIYLFKQGI